MDSFTITFTGKTSVLQSVFFPAIDLDGKYQIGLVDFQSYNSIYNVNAPDNVLYYHKPIELKETPKGNMSIRELSDKLSKDKILKTRLYLRYGKVTAQSQANVHVLTKKGLLSKLTDMNLQSETEKVNISDNIWYVDLTQENKIVIPEGNYEISEIEKEVQKTLPDFTLRGNNILMKCFIKSSVVFDFRREGMGKNMLGFVKFTEPDIEHQAHYKININNINVIRIKCSIASGSYINGKLDHTIHSFFPLVPPGYKLVEVPKNIIYFPINIRQLDSATVSIVDQNDKVIDFNGEEITLRCHIRKIS